MGQSADRADQSRAELAGKIDRRDFPLLSAAAAAMPASYCGSVGLKRAYGQLRQIRRRQWAGKRKDRALRLRQ